LGARIRRRPRDDPPVIPADVVTRLLAVAVVGLVVDIGENLSDVLFQLISLLGIIFAGGAAAKANKTANDVKRQTEKNGGASLRDAVDRIETAAQVAAVSTASLHEKLTNEPAPLPPPPPPPAAPIAGE
jgi:hypothetical protein